MEYLPEGDPDIQEADASDRATYPSGSNDSLQRMHACFARRVQEKIVVAPVTQTKRTLRNPRQQHEHDADFQAENNIEDDT